MALKYFLIGDKLMDRLFLLESVDNVNEIFGF
jgi:hypothetical protein